MTQPESTSEPEFPRLLTERLMLTVPGAEAAPRMLAFYKDNEEHLAPWSPPAPPDFYTEKYWRDRQSSAQKEFKERQSMRLVIFPREDADKGAVIGQCNFTNIVRGPFQACFLGYQIDYRAEGKGMMREALAAAIEYAFTELRLHRVMANYVPHNDRSGRLLRRLGFTVEGYARDYLLIAGEWRDHILTSLTNTKLKPENVRW